MTGSAQRMPSSGVEVLRQQRLPVWKEELWTNKRNVVYGPIASRRLGESLGINLFPGAKTCSFNCCYCDLGPTRDDALDRARIDGGLVSAAQLTEAIEKRLRAHLTAGTPIDHVTVCGNGEAVDHPDFVAVADFLFSLRERDFPTIPLAILTNSVATAKPDVARALDRFDVKFLKLDAGDEATFVSVARPLAGTPSFLDIVDGLEHTRSFFLQTAAVDSPQISNLASLRGPFVEVLRRIEPMSVFLHNIDYPTPDPRVRRLSLDEITALGDHIAERANLPVKVLHSLVDLRRRPRVATE